MNDKLNDALNEISDKHLLEVETYQKRRFPYWIAAAAAMVALAILLGFAIGSSPAAPTASNPLLDHHPHSSTCSCRPIPSTAPTTPPTTPRPSGILPPDSPVFTNLAAAPMYPQMVRYPKVEDFDSFQDYQAAEDAYRAAQKAQYD